MDTNATDHPVAEARANLSELLAAVRMLRRTYFLTSRGKRQAAVVPTELGELIAQVGGADAAATVLSAHLNA
ncbi:type II toxin-antitoxin system prevent-host-death family antitoxin [[Kitasatospora] papulosa]|uniref:type II toxin-antitoxin system prevent-host-death family antitoxin n=1 Tax=[Kitasatospora] papulosa TaxID=1464011 RepID=UPI003638B698